MDALNFRLQCICIHSISLMSETVHSLCRFIKMLPDVGMVKTCLCLEAGKC